MTEPEDFDDYAQIQALNWSTLKHIHVSAKLFLWRRDHPEPDRSVFIVGGAIHTATLEPDKFDQRYGVYAAVRRGEKWDAWQEENPDLKSLKPAEHRDTVALARALHDDPIAGPLLRATRVEASVTWDLPGYGLAAKGRLDVLGNRVVDLKSAADLSRRAFITNAAKLLYHGQLAWYHDGAIAAGKLPRDAPLPVIVGAEKSAPYDVGVFEMTQLDYEAGKYLYRSLVDTMLTCIETKSWPGRYPTMQALDLPHWAPGMGDEEEGF